MTLTHLATQLTGEPLAPQAIAGTLTCEIWARAATEQPTTWAVSLRVVSGDGRTERGTLLPLKIGNIELADERFTADLASYRIGPVPLQQVEAHAGDRIVAEIGSMGEAIFDFERSWIEFSHDFESHAVHVKRRGRSRRSRRIGECIYCQRRDIQLSDEHVIPYALNGELVIQQACCSDCAGVISAVERDVLRSGFLAPRTALGMNTRNPDKRPDAYPLIVQRDGNRDVVAVPIAEYPTYLAAPVFSAPTELGSAVHAAGIGIKGAFACPVSATSLVDARRRECADHVGIELSYGIFEFARMIGKIGYCYAILHLGTESIQEAFLLPAILGTSPDIGRWVGCLDEAPRGPDTGLHALTLSVDDGRIVVFVRLFAQFGLPEYAVVVGKST